jgi:hypothetical protein
VTILLAALWPALLTASFLGGCAGYWAGLPAGRLARAGAALLVGLTLATGAVALAGLVPGRPGLWVETAALLLAAYLAGCLVGGGLSRPVSD